MASKLSTHVYTWDGVVDPRALKPVECCATCGLPRRHERHDLEGNGINLSIVTPGA